MNESRFARPSGPLRSAAGEPFPRGLLRLVALTLLLAILALPARAATVRFPSGGDPISGYLARPSGPGPFPALVVIHEWWGLNDWVRQQADGLAREGYVVLAVDLYRGKVAAGPDEAHELSRGLPRDRALRDLKAAVDYLSTQRDVRRGHIGCIGWCMGGGYSLDLATADPRISAAVVAYGRLTEDVTDLAKLHGPVLGIFGSEDRGIPPEQVRAFWAAMARADRKLELHEFLGVGHAFMNQANQKGYDAGATASARQAIQAFLQRNLKGSRPAR